MPDILSGVFLTLAYMHDRLKLSQRDPCCDGLQQDGLRGGVLSSRSQRLHNTIKEVSDDQDT